MNSAALQLKKSYEEVSDRTWLTADFLPENLESSRALFTPESLAARAPRPKELEVYALLSGLPFPADFTATLAAVQRQISFIIGDTLHYWVASGNFGVEYCVFKWPDDAWQPQRLPVIREALDVLRQPAFRFSIGGIQINPDGCVVAKGFDENAAIFSIRQRMKAALPFLPAKQSGWAHVPLGRILEPVGEAAFAQLNRLMQELRETPIASTAITSLKLIHETRWYMEERHLLAEYPLTRGGG